MSIFMSLVSFITTEHLWLRKLSFLRSWVMGF